MGETDSTKKLVMKIGTDIYEINMSDIDGNFTFDISEEMIGEETYIEVYHEDYEQVKKTVKIVEGDITRSFESTTGEEILTIINDNLNGNTLGAVYAISLYKKLELDADKVKLETTNEELTFSLKIPDNLVNKNKKLLRTYKIVRIHNGEAETIDASYNKSKQTITFSSNKFSEFTLVYKDINNPKTGDNINLYIVIGIMSHIGLIGSIFITKSIKNNS